jgi:hypothetical protein
LSPEQGIHLKRKDNLHQIKKKIARKTKRGKLAHCDGKRLEEWGIKVERMPISLSGGESRQSTLLKVAKIPDGRGITIKNAVYGCLEEFGVLDTIVGFCFDTCSANTGVDNGAAILLEQEFGRKLLYFGCRLHRYDRIAKVASEELFGKSTGPFYVLYKQFRDLWDELLKDPEKTRKMKFRSGRIQDQADEK